MENNYMGVIQNSGRVEMLGAYLQRSVWREQRRELRDSPGLEGWEAGRVSGLMEELRS